MYSSSWPLETEKYGAIEREKSDFENEKSGDDKRRKTENIKANFNFIFRYRQNRRPAYGDFFQMQGGFLPYESLFALNFEF